MTITLVRPIHVDEALVRAALAGLPVELLECAGGCGAEAADEDQARDDLGWTYEDDDLVCEGCAAFAGPSGAYDRAYWG